jgi:proline iminopeptidase
MKRKSSSPRRLVGAALLSLAGIAAVLGAALSLGLALRLTESIALAGLTALGVSLLFGTGFGALAFRLAGARQARGRGHRFGLALTALVAAAGAVLLFKPLDVPADTLAARHDTRYWALATGSRLAYSHFPATGERRAEPIVFLHGGPGAPLRESEYRFFERFARDGYDVYLYEQLGTGRSDAPPDLRAYTVHRSIEDLEAIRNAVGAERLILVGQSWGAALAAHYTAAHPQRVAKLIFPSPGPMSHTQRVQPDARRTVGAVYNFGVPQPPLRVVAAGYLAGVNPQLAASFAPPQEMNGYMGSISPRVMDLSYCANQAGSVPAVDRAGFDFYANRLLQRDLDRQADVRPVLRGSTAPVLVMKGECDYVPWAVAQDYRRSFGNARLVYLEGTGHLLWGGQPDQTYAVMRAFLADAPLPARELPG